MGSSFDILISAEDLRVALKHISQSSQCEDEVDGAMKSGRVYGKLTPTQVIVLNKQHLRQKHHVHLT